MHFEILFWELFHGIVYFLISGSVYHCRHDFYFFALITEEGFLIFLCYSLELCIHLFFFILLYNTVLVLPYINMNPPRVYMSSQTWTPLQPPTPYHLSGSSLCTSSKHPVSCIKHRLAIHFLYDSIHVSVPFSQIIPPSPSPSASRSLLYFNFYIDLKSL